MNKFVSFLKSIGHGIKKVVDVLMSGEQKLGPIITQLDPALAPLVGIADRVVAWIKIAEGSFEVVGQASNGPAKLQAVVAAASTDFDAWIQQHLAGDVKLQDAENYAASKVDFVNAIVRALNSFSATQQAGALVGTGEALIAAAAAKAAENASTVTAPPAITPVKP